MRISDWSSDVCSSDLDRDHDRGKQEERGDGDGADGGDVAQPLQYADPEALPGPVADPGDQPFPRPLDGAPRGQPDGDEGDQRVQQGAVEHPPEEIRRDPVRTPVPNEQLLYRAHLE